MDTTALDHAQEAIQLAILARASQGAEADRLRRRARAERNAVWGRLGADSDVLALVDRFIQE